MSFDRSFGLLQCAALAIDLASLACPAAAARGTNAKAEKLARSITIYRDTYGVPHVYGPTDASCVSTASDSTASDLSPDA